MIVSDEESDPNAEESGGEEDPGAEPAPVDEPFTATIYEKIAAVVVLVLMVSAMGFVLTTVIMYWNQVGV